MSLRRAPKPDGVARETKSQQRRSDCQGKTVSERDCAGTGTRTRTTLPSGDFKSPVSTSSTIPACDGRDDRIRSFHGTENDGSRRVYPVHQGSIQVPIARLASAVHQTVSPACRRIASSQVTIAASSLRAWTISIRSKGSSCGIANTPAATASEASMTTVENPHDW
jgi:hypothetical protein